MPHPTIWLSEDVVDEMVTEATSAGPKETGGMLLGWENDHRNEVVILRMIGPGPAAVHSPTSFHPDGAWQQDELAATYRQSEGVVTYVGDWHVHPCGGFGMSRRDRRTMAKTALHPDARCRRPLMALLAWEKDRYRLGVWMWEPAWIRPIIGRAVSLTARTWAPSAEEKRFIGHRQNADIDGLLDPFGTTPT